MAIFLLILAVMVSLAGQWFDCFTTQHAIKNGKGTESNPVVAWVIKHLGFPAMYAGKMVMWPAVLLFLARTSLWGGTLSLPWQAVPQLIWGAYGAYCGYMNVKNTK